MRLYIEPAYPVVRGRYATIVRGRKAGVANFGWLPVRSGPGRIQTHDTRSRKPLETTSRLEECRFLSPSFVIPVERYYTRGTVINCQIDCQAYSREEELGGG